MSSITNVYIMEVLDSQRIRTIGGTEIFLEFAPPANTAAGEDFAKKLIRDSCLRWMAVNVVENRRGVLHTDRISEVKAPKQKYAKIEVLELLVKSVKGEGSMFHAKDFKEIKDAEKAVRFMVEEGFLTSKVSWFDRETDDLIDLTKEEIEEAKGHGHWYHPGTGEAYKFNGDRFLSSFLATSKLVRLAQGHLEPEPIDMEDAYDLVETAKEDAYDEIVLWLTRIASQGAEPLRQAAKVFAGRLRERAHKRGDLLVDWRPMKATVKLETGPQSSVVQPRRDYDREDVETENREPSKSPFGDRSAFWGD